MSTRLALLALLGLSLTGCPKDKSGCDTDNDCKGERVCKDHQCVAPPERGKHGKHAPGEQVSGAATAPTPAAPAAAAGFGAATIAAGPGPNGVWTAQFGLAASTPDRGRNYGQAMAQCQSAGKALCSETQWLKACQADGAVGNVESWTASWDGESVAVRGGSGCASRKLAPGGQADPARGAACCDRAIGIRGGTSDTFRSVAAADQLRYERALNAQDLRALDQIYGIALWFDQQAGDSATMDHDGAVKAQASWFKAHPTQWTLYDVCDSSVGDVPSLNPGAHGPMTTQGVVNDCVVVVMLGAELHVVNQRNGWFRNEGETENHLIHILHHGVIRKLAPL